jgi:predicted DNA-binding transcriptional regulator AlpA
MEKKLRRFLREREVIRRCGYGRTQLDDLIARGEFPKPFRLSDSGRAKGWDEDEIIEWQAQRMASRERGETAKPELNLSKARDKARSDPLKKRARHRRELPPAEARLTEKQATSNATSRKLAALEDTSSGEILSTAFREQRAFPDTS